MIMRYGFALLAMACAGIAQAQTLQPQTRGQPHAEYEVKITNITHTSWFSPALLSSHRSDITLFTAGEPATPALSRLAQEGDNAPLAAMLRSTRGVLDVETADGPVMPGKTITLYIKARPGYDSISLVSMIVPSNDAFVAINNMRLPWKAGNYTAIAYDAGGERNDELCASVPAGPSWEECSGPGGGAMVGGGEGYVFVHSGIHGVGDFKPSLRDWRNPVARISIKRVR